MEKGTYVSLVTSRSVTLYSLILVWMVQTFHCSMALIALESTFTVVPSNSILQCLTVLRRIFKEIRWPSEITCVVRIEATLRVVAVLFSLAPTRLVKEHIEDVALFSLVDLIQALVQVAEFKQARRHEIILDALVLKVAIHGLYELQVLQSETDQLVGCLVLIEGHYEGTVKAIVTEKLQFLRVVVPRQCLLRTFHVKNVKEKVRVLVVHLIVEWCSVNRKVGRTFALCMQVLFKDGLPDAFIIEKYF